jgi:hypothetical protein
MNHQVHQPPAAGDDDPIRRPSGEDRGDLFTT